MQCEQFMKRDVTAVRPEDSAQSAARLMKDRDIGFLPVCDDQGRVVGAVTDRDLATRLVAEALPANLPVGQLMTREIVACRPTDDVRRAEQLMAQEKVSRILCIDENSDRLAGVISLSDIAQLEASDRAADTLREVSAREARP